MRVQSVTTRNFCVCSVSGATCNYWGRAGGPMHKPVLVGLPQASLPSSALPAPTQISICWRTGPLWQRNSSTFSDFLWPHMSLLLLLMFPKVSLLSDLWDQCMLLFQMTSNFQLQQGSRAWPWVCVSCFMGAIQSVPSSAWQSEWCTWMLSLLGFPI